MKFLLLLSLVALALAGVPPQTRISGGVPAAANEFQYQVSVRVGGFHICSGIIIPSPNTIPLRFVLTAASCVDSQSVRLLEVKYGNHDRKEGTVVGVSRVIVHENFHNNAILNDIALLEISGTFVGVQPADLATMNDLSLLEEGIVTEFAGWGVGGITSGELQAKLQKVKAQVVDIAVCANGYKDLIQMNDHLQDGAPSRYCIGDVEHGIIAACAGDAGGAAYVATRFSGNKTVGIASFGAGCGTKEAHPSVFTFVGAYTQWIAHHIQQCTATEVEQARKLLM